MITRILTTEDFEQFAQVSACAYIHPAGETEFDENEAIDIEEMDIDEVGTIIDLEPWMIVPPEIKERKRDASTTALKVSSASRGNLTDT